MSLQTIYYRPINYGGSEQGFNKVYNKPVKTLERQFPSAKQKPPIE